MSRRRKAKRNRASKNQETQDFFKELLLMPQDFWDVAGGQIGDTVANLFNDIYNGKEDIENLSNYKKALNNEFTAEKISKLRDIEQNYKPYTKEEVQNTLKSQREIYLASHPELAAVSGGGQTAPASAEAQSAASTADGQSAPTEKLANLQKQFREKFPLKSEPKPEPSKAVKAGFFSEKAFISNFDENFSLTNARKRQLLETKWNKTLDEISPGAKQYTDKSMKMAMEKFSKDYNLNVDLSDYKTSMLGRIANRIRGNKNISKEEALERTFGAYSKKTNEYINNLKEQYQSGKITDRQYMRRANRGWTSATANGGQRVQKARNLGKLGWKGKGLAAVGLVALGGVISNMFSGGKKSNAELYNPNPQPQYYS